MWSDRERASSGIGHGEAISNAHNCAKPKEEENIIKVQEAQAERKSHADEGYGATDYCQFVDPKTDRIFPREKITIGISERWRANRDPRHCGREIENYGRNKRCCPK